MEKITSRDNKRLKAAKKVREGRSNELIFVEGLRLAEEALRSPLEITDCFVTKKFIASDRGSLVADAVTKRNVPVYELSEGLFESIADTKNSQGIILLCERPHTGQKDFASTLHLDPGRLALVVCLDAINNPSNLGAILRTAEAAGAAGVITTAGSADAFSPKSLRAAMGASFRIPLWQGEHLERVLDWAREDGILTTAAAGNGSETFTNIDWKKPRLLVLGSEGHGLSSDQLAAMDVTIRIPMDDQVESLNLAVACGIILFEARRQFYA